jgi:hypothetical protein
LPTLLNPTCDFSFAIVPFGGYLKVTQEGFEQVTSPLQMLFLKPHHTLVLSAGRSIVMEAGSGISSRRI